MSRRACHAWLNPDAQGDQTNVTLVNITMVLIEITGYHVDDQRPFGGLHHDRRTTYRGT